MPRLYASPNRVSIQNSTTQSAIYVDQNANTGTNPAVAAAVFIDNSDNTGIGLSVYSTQSASAAPLVYVKTTNAAFAHSLIQVESNMDLGSGASLIYLSYTGTDASGWSVLRINNQATSGTSHAIRIDMSNGNTANAINCVVAHTGHSFASRHTGTGYDLYIDHDVTNSNWTTGAINVTATSNVNNGSTITKSGTIFYFASDISATSGSVTDSAVVFNINQTNTGATGHLLFLNMDGTGKAVYVDHDDNGSNPSVHIDRDGNNASKLWALQIDSDNAGAGGVGAIDFSSFSTGETLFKITADATDPTGAGGAATGRIPIEVGGTTKYLAYY